MTRSYDLVVIGGGAAGLVAAREARRRGANALIIQDGPVGGDCTFTGCVPSKALLAAAAAGSDFGEAMSRVHRAVARIAATEDNVALARDGIDVVHGLGLQFTHVAGRMGWVAASNALSKLAKVRNFRFDATNVPWATFTSPEVGRVGLTDAEAGFGKLIAAPKRVVGHLGRGRLIGATVVAPVGGELVHEAAPAMQTNMFVGRLAQTTHAYPTWSMAIQQAAPQFSGPSAGLAARPVATASVPHG